MENLSWYYGDIAATNTPDNENVLAPNVGNGRYFKDIGRTPSSNLQWIEVDTAGNFNAIPNAAYAFNFTSIATDIATELPSNPVIGSEIRFLYASNTNIQRRIIINPGANPINGSVTSIFSFQRGHAISLVWVGGNTGWLYSSNMQLNPLIPY